MTNRICLIIDAGFFTALQKTTGPIELLKVKERVSKAGNITRAFYVTSYDGEEVKGFHNYIKSTCKMEVVVKGQKEKQCSKCGNITQVEKGMDIAISTLAIKHASKYDTLVVWNGDGDLYDSWQHIRDDLGKQIVVYGLLTNVSTDIQSITEMVNVMDIYRSIAK